MAAAAAPTSAITRNSMSAKQFLIDADLEKYIQTFEGFPLVRLCIMPCSEMKKLGLLLPSDKIRFQKHRKTYKEYFLQNLDNWFPPDMPDLRDLFPKEKVYFCLKWLKDLGITTSISFLLSYDAIVQSGLTYNTHIPEAHRKLYALWIDKQKSSGTGFDDHHDFSNQLNSEPINNRHSCATRSNETIPTSPKVISGSKLEETHLKEELLQGKSINLFSDPDAPMIAAEDFLKDHGISTDSMTLKQELEGPNRKLLNMNPEELRKTIFYLLQLIPKDPEIRESRYEEYIFGFETAIEPLMELTNKANGTEAHVESKYTRSITNIKIEGKETMEPSNKEQRPFPCTNDATFPDSSKQLPTYAEVLRGITNPFESFSHNERTSSISTYDDSKTLNILLLGGTGVGKSTAINAFLNYISYKSLDIAKKHKILAPIPASFSVSDDDFEDHLVRVGAEKEGYQNEAFNEVGQSSTQVCRSYLIETKQYGRIRIMDTPGLGDTRGTEKDNENIQNILSYISQFTHLNGICILLKPNDSRLTPSFHLLLTTLLMNLDATAAKNIIFLFTNARSTFYEPGDTKGILETVLQKIYSQPPYVKVNFDQSNTFCIDNESFRYLAAKKEGLDFLDAECASFGMSWERSVEQYDKLLRYAQNLTPYLLNGKKSLCEAKKMLTTLAEPAALIILEAIINIGTTGRNIQAIRSSTATQTEDIERLKQKLFTEVSETIYRPYCPRVVCCKSCNDRIEIVDGFIVHPKICFQFEVSSYGVEFRLHRWMDDNGFCLYCGCHPTCHDFTKQVPVKINRRVQDSNIFDTLSNYESLKRYSQVKENEISVQNREIQLLVEALGILTAYIERNSIFCPMDMFNCKLNAILKQEEAKATLGYSNQHVVRDLKNYIEMYNNHKLVGLREPTLDLTSIFNFVEIIYQGEFYGKKLRELVQNIELVEQAARKFCDEIISLSSTELETAV